MNMTAKTIAALAVLYTIMRMSELLVSTMFVVKSNQHLVKGYDYNNIGHVTNSEDAGSNHSVANFYYEIDVTEEQETSLLKSDSYNEQSHIEPVALWSDSPTKKHQLWPWDGQELMEKCYKKDWYAHGSLPTASVVIPFIDSEVLSTLLRTVHSIIKYSPPHLLEEIILVADNCERDDMQQLLDITLRNMFRDKVYVIRSNVTLGSIRARLTGIRRAKGEVVVSLDSHIEVQKNWLEPILYEIKLNKKTLASSYLDWIVKDENKWIHKHGPSTWVTNFDLELVFGFQVMAQKEVELRNQGKIDPTLPVRSPMTIGNWAIHKEFYTEIGELDDGAIFWGADNLDVSIKTWMFGGRVVNIPCSKTAHVEIPHARNYRAGKEDLATRNYKRVLKVWMPDHIQYFEAYNPVLKNMADIGDLTSRLALRAKAVHNFSWFLDNAYPELGIPQLHGLAWGALKNNGTGTCVELQEETLKHSHCSTNPRTTDFFWSKRKQMLRSPFYLYDIVSVNVGSEIKKMDMMTSYEMPLAKWIHWQNGPLRIVNTNLCLDIVSNTVSLQNCLTNKLTQLWSFSEYPKENQKLMQDIYKKYEK